MANRFRIRKIGKVEQYAALSLGVFIMAVAYYFFIIPSGLVTGGSTGIAIILHRLYAGIPISIYSLILNFLIMIAGAILLGKGEFGKSLLGSLLFPIFLVLFELVIDPPQFVASDLFLVTIYAGGLVGLGFGLVLRYGGTTGGSDIIIRIVQRLAKLPLSVSLYIVESIIIVFGAITNPGGFNAGFIAALYAVVVIFITGKVGDLILIGSQSKQAVNIITEKPKEIKAALFQRILRGVTEIEGLGGYTEHPKTMLITVIHNNEYHIVRRTIEEIDPKAFVFVTPASEIHGEWTAKDAAIKPNGETDKLQDRKA